MQYRSPLLSFLNATNLKIRIPGLCLDDGDIVVGDSGN